MFIKVIKKKATEMKNKLGKLCIFGKTYKTGFLQHFYKTTTT